MINALKKIVKDRLLPSSLLLTKLPENNSDTILLTFDDGPDPNVTPKVLDLLAQYNARAVFFIPGRRIEKAPYLLSQIIQQGHVIGNHSFIHANGKQPGFFAYLQDIKKCQKMIVNLCGVSPSFFRPPCGVVSLTTLFTPKFVGLQVMNWSLDVHDWQCKCKEDVAVTAGELRDNVQSGDIVLLHDDNKNVISLLRVVLPILIARGFDLKNGVKSVRKMK